MQARPRLIRREFAGVLGMTRLGAEVTNRLSMATALAGCVFSPHGGAMSARLLNKMKGLIAIPKVAGGAVVITPLLKGRQDTLALIHSEVPLAAREGRGRGKQVKAGVFARVASHNANTHSVTERSSGVTAEFVVHSATVPSHPVNVRFFWQRKLV